jgi:hypothetical protein
MEMITMLLSTTVFRSLKSNSMVARCRLASGLVAVALTLAVIPAYAQPAATKGANPKAAAPAAKTAVVETHQEAHASASVIPAHLTALKLTPEQQTKITGIIQTFNGSIGVASKQFSECYMQTIATEAAMLAAVEDNLTDAQREKIRAERSKTAQQEKPEAAKDERTDVAEAEIAVAGITLTEQQEEASEEIHHHYRKQMRALHRDIHHLHHRLLSLESDKLAQIEKVLTKDQLAQLRATRHHPAHSHDHSHDHAQPAHGESKAK